jgi:hypothetical protein
MRFATLVVVVWFAAVGLGGFVPKAQAHPGHSGCQVGDYGCSASEE